MPNPKAFISYSWTSPDHESWVLRLATELRESGVDVIFDKWDLREGHDAHAFMEKMVTDPEIKKVILICDKVYADKADGRKGGVGAEAQIISPEIYAKQDQDKFVAVLKERDEDGKPFLPVYYRSRIYIDLSDATSYSENSERLLRWIYDKPLYIKPELGKAPSFLNETSVKFQIATSSIFRRTMDAIKNGKSFANAAAEEYFKTFAGQFEKLRIPPDSDPFDEAVIQSIESFLPYRNEAIEMFQALALYLDNGDTRRALHHFFEQLIPYTERPEHIKMYRKRDFDNFRFLIHELFLYAIASVIQYERFDSGGYLLGTDYYIPVYSEYEQDVMVSFEVIRKYTESLQERNDRLNLRRLSIRADLLQERCKGVGINFQQIMQADFVIFMRDQLDHPNGPWFWWPETLLFVRHSVFEIFGRSTSNAYFNRVKALLGIAKKEDIEPLLQSFESQRNRLPEWGFNSFNPRYLMGFEQLATKP